LHLPQDGSSFLNIPYYSDANTELATVSIMTGPCVIPQQKLRQPLPGVLAYMADVPGCNVRSADNTSLVPLLVRDATINTTQPLLVRLVSNVTLGPNLPRSIVFARPVVIVGASSSLVSVDLGGCVCLVGGLCACSFAEPASSCLTAAPRFCSSSRSHVSRDRLGFCDLLPPLCGLFTGAAPTLLEARLY
jgi:hypothetical protein